MTVLQPLFWVVILLGIMILIHELGHYWAALSVGIKVETFSIGFGPRLFGFQRGDTDFRVAAIPFGGYVRMLGELPGDESGTDPRSFQAKARWQRAIVVIAGPLMNVILAIGIVTGLYMINGYVKIPDTKNPVISSVQPGSAAAAAGILPGDRVLALEGKVNPDFEDIDSRVMLSPRHPLQVSVLRGSQRLDFTITPQADAKTSTGDAGWTLNPDVRVLDVEKNSPAEHAGLRKGDLILSVNKTQALSTADIVRQVTKSAGHPVEVQYERGAQKYTVSVAPRSTGEPAQPWRVGLRFGMVVKLGFVPALGESIRANERYAGLIYQSLRGIVERRISPKSLAGPIGIAQESGKAAQEGIASYLELMAAVSLNLAIFNLLPIPILDGGTLLMLVIEMLLQREVSLRVKETVFKVGFVFLMMIVVFVIYNDISRALMKS